MRPIIESRGIRFSVEIERDPIWVDGDPSRLQQIQANLLSNAAKYTPAGGHVLLKAGREEGAAVIRVRDDGAGIHTEMLESIFDLFVQSTRTLDRSAGGLGVGLTLVRALVGMHGGMVTVDQRRGRKRERVRGAAADHDASFRSVTPRRPNRVRVRAFGGAPRSWSSRTAPTVAICCASCWRRRGSSAPPPKAALPHWSSSTGSIPRLRFWTSDFQTWMASSWRGGCVASGSTPRCS